MQKKSRNLMIILCPGQGAQHVGMGKDWCEASDAAAKVFQQADHELGLALSDICYHGPEDGLNRTDIAQAAIYVTSVAGYQAMIDTGELDAPAMTAGLSLGEFTALHLAGAFSFTDGLRLVRLRGQAMQAAAEASDSSMVALIGADEEQARELCQQAADGQVLVPANFNCPGQIVISGERTACERSLEVAEKMGLRATALKVAGAFHSPLMQPAADKLAAALDQVAWSQPSVPVLSNVTGLPHDGADIASIKRRLVEQLTQPVRWASDMQWATQNFTGRYVELPPGKVLAGLMRRIDKSVKVEPAALPTANERPV